LFLFGAGNPVGTASPFPRFLFFKGLAPLFGHRVYLVSNFQERLFSMRGLCDRAPPLGQGGDRQDIATAPIEAV
jgi:hypothetical protein